MAKRPCRLKELLSRTGQTKAGVWVDLGAFGLLVRVRSMMNPE